ncbi:MAG: MFS transporter [Candidatus Thorarchaeota archaeon]
MIISKKSVLVILATVFFIYFSIMMMLTYLPQFLTVLEIESSIITLTMTVFMFSLFLFPSFIGKYSDKLQNRIYFIFIGTIGMLITIFFLLFTRNIILLNIEIFIFGFFTSFLTIYLTLFSELVQDDKKWISYYNSICSVGNFLGVLMGGIFIDIFRIQNLFLFSLISFLVGMIFIVFIREDRNLILSKNDIVSRNNDIEFKNNEIKENNNISHSIYYSLFFRSFGIIPIVNILVIIMSFYIINNVSIGFLVGLNPLLQCFIILFIGKIISDKNIKFIMIMGYTLSIFVIIGYIISINFWSFFLFQVLLSLSYSMFWISTIVYIAQNSTPANKGRFIGHATTSIYAGTTVGGIFFSLLLAAFNSNYYISMSFMILFPILSTLSIIFLFKLPKNTFN